MKTLSITFPELQSSTIQRFVITINVEDGFRFSTIEVEAESSQEAILIAMSRTTVKADENITSIKVTPQ